MVEYRRRRTIPDSLEHSQIGSTDNHRDIIEPVSGKGKLFIESSSVKGEGEVSIKDSFEGSAMNYNDRMMATAP